MKTTITEMPYEDIVQKALLGTIPSILHVVVENGGNLPGRNHFYISFDTRFEGVEIPKHLRERHPTEMTIILQNRFWGLEVAEDHFSVGLSFSQVPATLRIPYAAITAFADPEAEFQLQFVPALRDEPAAEDSAENASPEGENVVAVDFSRRR